MVRRRRIEKSSPHVRLGVEGGREQRNSHAASLPMKRATMVATSAGSVPRVRW